MTPTLIKACLAALLGACATHAAELVVDHFPAAAYRNEEATFVLRGAVGRPLTISLNDKPLVETTFAAATLKQPLLLPTGGTLVFESGDSRREFRLLRPDDQAELTERDGFLYADNHPAILLPDHHHPPKHDRTWEGWKLLKSLVITPEERRIASLTRLSEDVPETTFHELHARILESTGVTAHDLILLPITTRDLEHGVSRLTFRMQLEWLLQRLTPHKQKQLQVVLIFDSPATWDQYQYAKHTVRLASRAHSAEFATLQLTPGDHADPDGIRKRLDALLNDRFAIEAGTEN